MRFISISGWISSNAPRYIPGFLHYLIRNVCKNASMCFRVPNNALSWAHLLFYFVVPSIVPVKMTFVYYLCVLIVCIICVY
jgi:hypothetical protein